MSFTAAAFSGASTREQYSLPIALPQGPVAAYLAAVGAAGLFVRTRPLRVGAGTIAQLPRPCVEWLAWARRIEDADRIVTAPDLLWQTRNGVKVARSLPEIIAAIEQQARALGVVLTPHAKAIERAAALRARVDQVFADLQASGELKRFNHSYREHRLSAGVSGEKVLPYSRAVEELRRVLIATLAEVPRNELSPLLLAQRICKEFSWYR